MERDKTGDQVLITYIYISKLEASLYNAAAETMRENDLGNVTVVELHQQEYDPESGKYVFDSFQYTIEFDSSESKRVFELLNQGASKHTSQAEDQHEARRLGIDYIRKTAKQIKEGTFPPVPEV